MCSRSRAESASSRAKSDLADLDQLLVEPVPTPGDGQVGPRRQDQVDIGWNKMGEAAEVGDEGGIRQMVEVVEDDDHLGELGQLGLQRFEQRGTEPATVQGHQGGQVGEVGVDGGQTPEQSVGEADRVVVVGTDLDPDKSQLRMSVAHWARRTVFPAPAGATIRVSERVSAASSWRRRRVRSTAWAGTTGNATMIDLFLQPRRISVPRMSASNHCETDCLPGDRRHHPPRVTTPLADCPTMATGMVRHHHRSSEPTMRVRMS